MVVLFRVKCNDKNERNACEQRATLIEIWFEQHAAGIFEELASRFVMKFVHIRMKTNEKKKQSSRCAYIVANWKIHCLNTNMKKKTVWERKKLTSKCDLWRRISLCSRLKYDLLDKTWDSLFWTGYWNHYNSINATHMDIIWCCFSRSISLYLTLILLFFFWWPQRFPAIFYCIWWMPFDSTYQRLHSKKILD